ncbi:MAG: FtsX-like permease family protein, partial [Eubacteriales bacterium]
NDYINIERELYVRSFMRSRTFESYYFEENPESSGGGMRLCVEMREGESTAVFYDYYILRNASDLSDIRVSYTPRAAYADAGDVFAETLPFILLALMSAASAVTIALLYWVRINRNRFMYGIYMTFGAGFKRLITVSVFEMAVLSLAALIPAALVCFTLSSLFYGRYGVQPVFSASAVAKVILADIIVSVLGVYTPMKLLSRATPVSLLTARDNSNLVSSPRRSTLLVGGKAFSKYEPLGAWRMRKYYVRLLAGVSLFCAMFLCGVYISRMNMLSTSMPFVGFTVENQSDSDIDIQRGDIDYLYGKISELDGIDSVEWEISLPASEMMSVMLINKDMRRGISADYVITEDVRNVFEDTEDALAAYAAQGYTNVTYGFKYVAFDEDLLSVFNSKYKIDGDIYSVLRDENTVIVGNTVNNTRKYDFKVGDKVVIAISGTSTAVILDPFDTAGVLSEIMSKNQLEFREYTVGAVIQDCEETEGMFTVGMNYDAYALATGEQPVAKSVTVNIDPGISDSEYSGLTERLTEIVGSFAGEYRLVDMYGKFYRDLSKQSARTEFGFACSLMLLALSPTVWFYSQSSFFKKRQGEVEALRACGYTYKAIGKIFKTSGILLAALGFVSAAAIGLAANYAMYRFMNNAWFASFGFGEGIRYEYSVSPPALALCLAVCAVCGYMSSYLPYLSLSGKMKKHDKGDT